MSDPQQPTWVEKRVRDELTAALSRAVERPADGPEPALPGASLPRFGRPVTFNAAMVRAILAGNKTQTRRPIQPAPAGSVFKGRRRWPVDESGKLLECRLAEIGEPLWVREPWKPAPESGRRRRGMIEYEADHGPAAAALHKPWRAGRFLARSGSRLTLHVKAIWPQQLSEMTPQEAVAEGMPPALLDADPAAAVAGFRKLWDKIYGETEFAWAENPWVWVIRFKAALPDERLY